MNVLFVKRASRSQLSNPVIPRGVVVGVVLVDATGAYPEVLEGRAAPRAGQLRPIVCEKVVPALMARPEQIAQFGRIATVQMAAGALLDSVHIFY